MVSITSSAAAGAYSTRVETSRATDETENRDEKAEETRGSSAPEPKTAEEPAVVYAGKIAEMRRNEEANAVQPTRSPVASAVVPAARLFDITV